MTTHNEWKAAYSRRRRRLIAAGQWRGPVDATVVTRHINDLRARGLSLRTIAEAAGLPMSTITPHAYPDTHQQGHSLAAPTTVDAILAVTYQDAVSVSPFVPVTGSRRRIEALQCMGWSQGEIGRRLGVSTQAVARTKTSEEKITVERAARIDVLYRELCMVPGPDRRTRTWAAKAGYVPPLAWDDIDEDEHPTLEPTEAVDAEPDPVVVDRLLTGARVDVPPGDRPGVVRALAHHGLSDKHIARLIDVWPETVLRIRRRTGIPAAIPTDGVGINAHNQRGRAA